MSILKKLKLSIWKKLSVTYKYSEVEGLVSAYDKYRYPPSAVLMKDLQRTFTRSKIEGFENGINFSSYHISWFNDDQLGHSIYKTTTSTYPVFTRYDSVEAYFDSFSVAQTPGAK